MKRSELSKEDQALLATDFGDLDKVAAEQVKVANEMYAAGATMAQNVADEMDKTAAAADAAPADDADESEKVAATDYGNIITEGFLDKLASLGVERHGDADHYFIPFVEEKIAEAGARAAVKKFWDMAKSKGSELGAKAKSHAAAAGTKAKEIAYKVEGAANPMHNFRAAKSGVKPMTGASGGKRDMIVHRGVEAGKGAAKTLAGGGLMAGGLYAATRGKKED